MKLPKFKEVFRVRIVYKSGYYHDIDMYEFQMSTGISSSAEWKSATPGHRPIQLGIDDISAVFQMGSRKKIVWG